MRGKLATAVIVMVALATFGTAGMAGATPGGSGGHAPIYYLSLGDSLARGVQPNASGQSVETNQGYVDDLFAAEHAISPTLRLVKLGCPGETTGTMIDGGICTYPHGSQLEEAVSFLHAHRQFVAFVTIDIGGNDIEGCVRNNQVDQSCIQAAFASVGTNLPAILSALRGAAGPGVEIVGMNYYDPFLAAYFGNPSLAIQSESLAVLFNGTLDGIYGAAGSPVADVQTAFHTTDFFTIIPPGIPLNVALICQWTWMCAPPPMGPNIHANAAGYQVIAEAFQAAL